MQLTDELNFDHENREALYEFVERNGVARRAEIRRALNMSKRAVGHHVSILKRDGILEEDDGELRVAFESGAEEEFRSDGIEFTIRPARREDLTGLVGAIRQSIGGGEYVEAERMADLLDTEGVLLRHNERGSRMFFVATVDGEVVGWVHLRLPELDKLQHTAELTLGVLEAYRGSDIGSHLLERGLGWARSQGFEHMYNSIPATNQTAIEFLTEHGWEEEARRENHYKLDGEYVDEVMMAITL